MVSKIKVNTKLIIKFEINSKIFSTKAEITGISSTSSVSGVLCLAARQARTNGPHFAPETDSFMKFKCQ